MGLKRLQIIRDRSPVIIYVNFVGFGDWPASLTGERSLGASLYAGQPNSRISTNQLYTGFMVVVLEVYEIPQGNSHYTVCRIPHTAAKHAQIKHQFFRLQTALYNDI